MTEKQSDKSWLAQYYTAEKPRDADGNDSDLECPDLSAQPADKYTLSDEVGQGGMKQIRKASDRDSIRTVAMATLKDSEQTPLSIRRFVREARITAFLEHPNIVPVHDVGLDPDGKPFFTMKLLRGESLSNVLRSLNGGNSEYADKYDLPHMIEIFMNVCNAIAFAHSKGVLHMDLKPSNIQINDFGEALVIDWGLAKLANEDDPEYDELISAMPIEDIERTCYGAIKGSPGFMAPEQARGDNSVKDERTDVYSLGAILYAMLTWQPPFDRETAHDVIQATIDSDVTAPSRKTPERTIPAALEAVALKALSKEPKERYQSVDDLKKDILAYIGGFATSAQDPGILTLLWLRVKRHRVVSALSAVSLLIIITLSAVSIDRIRKSEKEAVSALKELENEQAEKQKIGLLAAPDVAERAIRLYEKGEYDAALRELQLAQTLDPDLEEGLLCKGYYLLGKQDFKGAHAALSKAGIRARKMGGLALDYHRLNTSQSGKLTIDETKGFLEQLTGNLDTRSFKNFSHLRKGLIHQVLNGPEWNYVPIEVKMDFLKKNLVTVNKPLIRSVNMNWKESDAGLELDLSNNPKMEDIGILRGLPLVKLDLSDTAAYYVEPLVNMKLEYLDISNTQIKDLRLIRDLPLKELRIQGIKGIQIPSGLKARLENLIR